MVSTCSLQEKFNQVRNNFCFYLDIQDHGIARTLAKRIDDLGLQKEVFLTEKVTHIVRDTAAQPAVSSAKWVPRESTRSRADAMLQRIQPETEPAPTKHAQKNYITLTVQKAVILLDKIYDRFFSAPHKTNVKVFKKHFIKIEFLDKACRPIYKEFDEWPELNIDPEPQREKKETLEKIQDHNQNINTTGQKMTRKNRPRLKDKDSLSPKGGYCEMCNTDYLDAILHRRSPQHLAFVRDQANFLALDSLIEAGADVASFLDKATSINGERRSLRKICNGDSEPKNKRSKRSQSPDSTFNGQSPKRNGGIEDDRRLSTRCSKRISESQISEDRQYYKVVGVSTKLRSSGGFPVKKKESPPTCNGAKPLVVKFRKIRQSELSVLSDEAEQFMFPKRASSSSSDSSDEDDEDDKPIKNQTQNSPTLERRRLARPLALKEESSEEDSWPEDKRRRKRRMPTVVRRTRRTMSKPIDQDETVTTNSTQNIEDTPITKQSPEPDTPQTTEPGLAEVNPLREEVQKCMKWENGRLKYTPAVEQLEFAFESVPQSEPWFETFKRQDEDRVVARNVSRYFSLYSTKSPKLPYEIGQLPPLKPNCCPLSDFVKREEKSGPSRSYGTRGMKKQKIRKRTTAAAAVLALESHPRKSPREHASTLAILGSAGLLHRRKNGDDTKSTASEDTISETLSNINTKLLEPIISESQEASERLQQFLSEVFDDAAEYDLSEETMEGHPAVVMSSNAPDVLSLVSECDRCDLIREEMREGVAAARPRARRGRSKKNRTGWPLKKKPVKKKSSGQNSPERKAESSLDRSSAEPPDGDTTQESASEADDLTTIEEADTENDRKPSKSEEDSRESMDVDEVRMAEEEDSDDKPLQLDVKVLLKSEDKKEPKHVKNDTEDKTRSSVSESSDKEDKNRMRKKRNSVQALGNWLQPVVRVARVDPGAARRLRSAGRARSSRFR